ncbi:hypothetical protein M2360_000895 [Rhizobium sp. SG_E_25_P2]|uniref:hypothetical protein n=1 Tax=Rhizobium sp. SG_E_25_P2 TaxID=2879942 RepID=UPI0024732BFD|nr:hypothetical protein [Rhizobium sp. SG_E_25_P2]MDH6265505.1 hypothetical protein [Rhizobium sp. SG_E_25_P2]
MTPAASPKSVNQRRMDRLRATLSGGAPDYRIEADADATRLYEPETGALVVTVHHAAAHIDRDRVLAAIDNIDWLLGCYDRLIERLRAKADAVAARQAEAERQERKADLARACAIETQKPAFIRFLRECHDLEDASDQLRIDTRVRSLLKVRSRTELNTDPDAAARWRSLRAEFQAWMATP